MKILQVHNSYRFYGGETVIFEVTSRILADKGQEVFTFERDSNDVRGLREKMCAFAAGIYSRSAKKAVSLILRTEHPDVIHVHNLYPLISPSVLVACREAGVPVVMRCPDYRLICPTRWFFSQGRICEACTGGHEYWCILKNCRKNLSESIAYALRCMTARKFRFFQDNITCYVPPTEFVKNRLVEAGFPEERITVLPNVVSIPDSAVDPGNGCYIAYAGRISPEKGIETFLASARRTGLPVSLAGDHSQMPDLLRTAPTNAQFIGYLSRDQLVAFYRNARFLVVPSICFEAFGLVAAEAMSHGLPVIASRIGGLPEVVQDGITGLLFEPGKVEELADKMKQLWGNPTLCRKMGQAGREKVIREYNEDVYYERLMTVYDRALAMNKSK